MQNLGRFEIVEEIGRGGCGVVYKALDPKIGRHVAIKTILPDGSSTPSPKTTPRTGPRSPDDTATIHDARSSLYQRLLLEARSAGRMSHPNIVVIHELDEQDGVTFIVMEYVAGRTLSALTGAAEEASLDTVFSILRQAADGMDYAHENGVVHRDIKPANMLVTSQNLVKITDFGIAKVLMSDVGLTRTGTAMGTAFYMSPEQIGGQPVSAQTDQWALGVIAFELLAGRKPFTGDSWPTVLNQILNVEPPALSSLRSGLPAGTDEVLRRVLSKEAANRFASCTEFVRALQSCVLPNLAYTQSIPLRATVNVAAPIASLPEVSTTGAPPAARKWWIPVAAGAAIAAIAGTFVWVRLIRPDASASTPAPPAVSAPAQATPPVAAPPPPAVDVPAVAETAKQPVAPARIAASPTKQAEKTPEVKGGEPPPESVTPPPVAAAPPAAASNVPPPPVVQPKPVVVEPPPAKPAPPPPTPADERAWSEIANSKSAASFEQFRREHPNSPHAKEAGDRLAQLETERKAAEAATLVRQNRQLADGALQKYREAFEHRNIDELRRIWPGLTAQEQASFRDFFKIARAVTMTLRLQGEPEVSADAVTVRAVRSIQMTSERGREPAQDNPVVIRLKRSGQEMLIESIALAR